jgi:hypothetical protein
MLQGGSIQGWKRPMTNKDNSKRGDKSERNKNSSGNNASYTDQARRDGLLY